MSLQEHPYVRAAIEGELSRLAGAQEGERNSALFKSTASLASLGLREGEILDCLKPAAEATGLRGRELYATIKSGVKAGRSRPRELPQGEAVLYSDQSGGVSATAHVPRPNEPQPFLVRAGDEGPPKASDEVRRHAYRRDGKPVRFKIKRASGAFVNWYRVADGAGEGWQPAKPEGYLPCPYFGELDPFDRELSSDILYWPEGEKDCDTLGRAALPAFTFGGTGDGLPQGVEAYLRGRHVVILADNDIGGRDHAHKKAQFAQAVAASVKVIEFTNLPPKGDVTDFLESNSVAELESLVEVTPNWSAPSGSRSILEGGWRSVVISASDLKQKVFKPIRFVVPGYIPEGVTIFAGKPKIGKSWLLYDVCLAAAADRFVLGTIKPAQGEVLYLALEDSQRRLKSRLNKLCPDGVWPTGLTLATEWRRADAGGLADIADWCNRAHNPVLVVIDTLEKLRAIAKIGAPAYSTDYQAIAGLHKLAHDLNIAIVVIHHVRKMEADDPFDMVSGTNGLTGAADTILVLKKQSGNVTLYARGRDIDEKETACEFDRSTCRWRLLGEAGQVNSSGERSAIIGALSTVDDAGLHIGDIMAATGRSDRNAVDQLLFKMHREGELCRLRRGVYALPGKIGKKERNESQVIE